MSNGTTTIIDEWLYEANWLLNQTKQQIDPKSSLYERITLFLEAAPEPLGDDKAVIKEGLYGTKY